MEAEKWAGYVDKCASGGGGVEDIPLYLNREQVIRLLGIAKEKLEGCRWVLTHEQDYRREDWPRIQFNATTSAEFWGAIVDKLASQMG